MRWTTCLALAACGGSTAGDGTQTGGTSGDTSGGDGTTDAGTTSASTNTSSPGTTAPATTGTVDDTGSSEAGTSSESGHTVTPCDEIGRAGVWEHITPAEVNLAADFETPAGENYGVHSFVIDPQDTATLYLGTSAQGLFRTTDCGASWTHVDTGTNAETIDGGRQWTLVIDPVDPQVLYTNTGYGAFGAWKSTNGGVDWMPLVDEAHLAALQFGGFVQYIRMDPTNHEHILVTPHFSCEIGAVDGLPVGEHCMLESMDAGATWTILEGTPVGGEGVGQKMVDASTWFWAEGFDGLWRTDDAGASWAHVYAEGYATAAMFQLPDGGYLTGGVFSTLRSDDGITWTAIPDSPGTEFITGDATTVYASRNGYYQSAPANDPTTWTDLPTPDFPTPDYVVTWDLQYDADHRILYSLNSRNGFWRLVTE